MVADTFAATVGKVEKATLSTPGTSRSGCGRVAVLVLAMPWFVPLNFAKPPASVRTAYLLAALLGALLLVRAARNSHLARGLVVALAVSASGSLLAGGSRQATLLLVGEVALGYALLRTARHPLTVVTALYAASTGSLLLDGLTREHNYARVFPKQYFEVSALEFRARGVIGQPVPGAMLALVLCTVLWVACPTDWPTRHRLAARSALAGTMVGSLWATGSRSALVVAAVVVLVHVVVQAARRPAAPLLLPLLSLLPALALALHSWGGVLLRSLPSTLRVVDFAHLSGSQSYVIRSRGFSVLASLPDTCPPCVLFGHGNGALAQQLRQGYAVQGFSTLDNQFITWYWDYGWFALALLLTCAVYSCRVLLGADTTPAQRGFATGLLVLLLASGFYEALSLSTGAIALGMCLAGISRRAPVPSRRSAGGTGSSS